MKTSVNKLTSYLISSVTSAIKFTWYIRLAACSTVLCWPTMTRGQLLVKAAQANGSGRGTSGSRSASSVADANALNLFGSEDSDYLPEDEAMAPTAGFGSWEELAEAQQRSGNWDVTAAMMVAPGMPVAFYDRNDFRHEFRRKVFVVPVRAQGDRDKVEIFDQNSQAIDEPSYGVRNGLQSKQSFTEDAKNETYYKLPPLRAPPRDRSALPLGSPRRSPGRLRGGGEDAALVREEEAPPPPQREQLLPPQSPPPQPAAEQPTLLLRWCAAPPPSHSPSP